MNRIFTNINHYFSRVRHEFVRQTDVLEYGTVDEVHIRSDEGVVVNWVSSFSKHQNLGQKWRSLEDGLLQKGIILIVDTDLMGSICLLFHTKEPSTCNISHSQTDSLASSQKSSPSWERFVWSENLLQDTIGNIKLPKISISRSSMSNMRINLVKSKVGRNSKLSEVTSLSMIVEFVVKSESRAVQTHLPFTIVSNSLID